MCVFCCLTIHKRYINLAAENIFKKSAPSVWHEGAAWRRKRRPQRRHRKCLYFRTDLKTRSVTDALISRLPWFHISVMLV